MAAVVTTYGELSGQSESAAALRALDLLRSYAHDCLHYGSFREYTTHQDELVRLRYGFNLRYLDGATYSGPDSAGTRSTRNLGVLMEGATDREARAVVRITARRLGLVEPAEPLKCLVFRDATGQLTDSDRAMLAEQKGPVSPVRPDVERYFAAMAEYTRTVNDRYDEFLTEIGGNERDALHALIVAAMVSGRVDELCGWLDQRHGPRTFERLFRQDQRDFGASESSASLENCGQIENRIPPYRR